MGARSEAPNGDGAARVRLQARGAAGQFDLGRRHPELRGRHRLQLAGDLLRAHQHRAAYRRGETVGVVARGDVPGRSARIELGQHVDVLRVEAQLRGNDLRRHGGVPLTVRRAVQVHADRSARVYRDGGRRVASGFRFGAAALLCRLRQADIGHVRAGGLDAERETDAEQFAALARFLAPLQQRRIVGEPQRLVETALVVSRVQHRARRAGIGELVLAHQVAAPDLGHVDVEAARRHLHDALEGEVELRPAEAAIEARRHAIGHHQHILYRNVLHAVGAVRGGVHAIDRGRLGCADVRAEVDDIAKAQAQQLALVRERTLDAAAAIGGRGRGRQVLEPVFGPFHRHADEAAHGRYQHHVGVHRLLDAETAARIGRRDHAQAIAGNVEAGRHQRLQHERALEVRPDRVAVRMRLEVRDHAVGFHRRRDRARVTVLVAEHPPGAGERAVRVAVLETALLGDVAARLLEQQRRVRRDRILEERDALQRLVLDLDQLQRVFGDIAVLGHHHRHRLAHVAHLVDRAHVEFHARLDHARNRARHPGDLGAGDDADHACKLLGAARVDAEDLRVRVGRAQDRRVAQTRHRFEIVDEAPAAGEQRLILLAQDRLADPACDRARRLRHRLARGAPRSTLIRALTSFFMDR